MWYLDDTSVTLDNVNYFWDGRGPTSPTLETISVVITGLVGSITLANNTTDTLTETSNGTFAFATQLAIGATYSVTVTSTPPGQTVTLTNPTGVVGSGPVTVGVACLSNPVITPGSGRPGGRLVIPPKRVSETIAVPFNFISSLQIGETIASATTTCTVYSGTDPTPSSVIDGAPVIAGTTVSQGITGGVTGVLYGLLCEATTSFNEVISQSAILVVIPDFI
jgi:hypothetical protein